MTTLSGRAALITGGMTGQGRAIAHAMAAEGAHVAVGSYVGVGGRLGDAAAYPEEAEIEAVHQALAAPGIKVFAGHLDVRNGHSIQRFVTAAEECCGPFDILVNAAGLTDRGNLLNTSPELFDKIFAVNVRAPFFLMQEAVKHLTFINAYDAAEGHRPIFRTH